MNGQTPPLGFVLGNNGFATPSTHLVSAVQRSIVQTTTVAGLPPPPASIHVPNPNSVPTIAPIPPVINTATK